MKRRVSIAVLAGAALLGAVLASPARASAGEHGHSAAAATKVFVLDPSTHGNPEGVAWDPASKSFFVGALGDGTIYRGTLGSSTATVFIAGPGKPAVGMKVSGGKLYVAGGPSGEVRVYDLATRALVALFDTGAGGFLNDLVVTEHGDVYVTDSFRPTLFHITASQVAAGAGMPDAIDVSGGIPFQTGFNLNGIVAIDDGDALIVVQSNTGKLFRVEIGADDEDGATSATPAITQLAVEPLVGGDGLLIDQGRLIVVQGGPVPTLNFVKLRNDATAGTVVERRTDPTLRTPSTVARAGDVYLVVNADFATNTTPFTVSGLRRGHADD